ncbi:hypothetical protein [Sphingomonas faeni]|uniref:hypothetical protein n=1 Tax=Sphingomonas faeni TaxID=185950 RepID=UPI00334DDE7F
MNSARGSFDLPVIVLVVMVSAAGSIRMRPDAAIAVMIGTPLGAPGAGIISITVGWVRRTEPGGEDQPTC